MARKCYAQPSLKVLVGYFTTKHQRSLKNIRYKSSYRQENRVIRDDLKYFVQMESINKRLIERKATASGHEMIGNYRGKLINRRSYKNVTYEYNKK